MFYKWIKDQIVYKRIKSKNYSIKREKVKSILIFYDLNKFYIGDSLKSVSNLRLLKIFYPIATIEFVASNPNVLVLLKNSPYLERATHQGYSEIAFNNYDVVLMVSDNEVDIFDFLVRKYWSIFNCRPFTCAMFSIINTAFNEGNPVKFPANEELTNHKFSAEDKVKVANTEIFLSDEEQIWANRYLIGKGIGRNESLIILPDTASNSQKLLNKDQFFQMIRLLLEQDCVKVLIYDVDNVDKESAYTEALGALLVSKIIFAQGLSLRESICLLGSEFTSMIIGPCTGIMHCASGVSNTMKTLTRPVIVVYKGSFDKIDLSDDPYWWWGDNRLIECLLLLKRSQGLVSLSETREQISYLDLDCTNKIQASQLIDSIKGRFESSLENRRLRTPTT